eukprot:Gb_41409 [translate_table: standard]
MNSSNLFIIVCMLAGVDLEMAGGELILRFFLPKKSEESSISTNKGWIFSPKKSVDSSNFTNKANGFCWGRLVLVEIGVYAQIDEEDGSDQDEQVFTRAHGQRSTQSVKSVLENRYSRAKAGKSIASMIPSVTVDL